MRSRSVVPVLVALSVGVTAAAAVRRFVGRRRASAVLAVPAVPAPPVLASAAPVAVQDAVGVEAVREAVVLPFTRPVAPAPERPSLPARCGDSGGRTKAGAPCAARATSEGRCHHHRIAA